MWEMKCRRRFLPRRRRFPLNPDVYHALQAVDATKADAATKYYLEHTLLEYRLSGIDKDAATRGACAS